MESDNNQQTLSLWASVPTPSMVMWFSWACKWEAEPGKVEQPHSMWRREHARAGQRSSFLLLALGQGGDTKATLHSWRIVSTGPSNLQRLQLLPWLQESLWTLCCHPEASTELAMDGNVPVATSLMQEMRMLRSRRETQQPGAQRW